MSFYFDWDDFPSSANYLAMDKNGMWNLYEKEPEMTDDQWDFGNAICEVEVDGFCDDWTKSLRKRP